MHTKIKTFENACKKLGISMALPNVEMIPKHLQKQVIADYKLVVIAEALNEGWKPDWNNSSEYKYYPWFKMSSSGVGFSCGGCGCVGSVSVVGSRLVFKNIELAKYFGKQFINIHKVARTI
jgi:hypothetical protein